MAGLGAGLALLATSPETFPEVQTPELLRETRALPLRTARRTSPEAGQPPPTPQREAGQPPHAPCGGRKAPRGAGQPGFSPQPSPAQQPARRAPQGLPQRPAAAQRRLPPPSAPSAPSAPQVGSRLTCGVPPGGAADEEPGEAAGGQAGSRRPPHAPAERPR